MSALRSTHKPSAAALAASAPLPPGWTEHKAPTGHNYYYNASTKESTYKRPGASEIVAGPIAPPPPPQQQPYAHLPSLADPRVANAFLAQLNRPPPQASSRGRGGLDGGRGGRGAGGGGGAPKPQPVDKPRRREAIPGCEPWVLVYTKYSRRFVYNPVKNASFWRIPEKLMPAILEMDKRRVQGKAVGDEGKDDDAEHKAGAKGAGPAKIGAETMPRRKEEEEEAQRRRRQEEQAFDSDEYEEVEVTDDEDGDDVEAKADGRGEDEDEEAGEDGHVAKRQRMLPIGDDNDDDDNDDDEQRRRRRQQEQEGGGDDLGPVEFTEADIALQLQAMGEQYDLEPGDYDDGNMDTWPEGTEGVDFTEDDGKFLFRDMLGDLGVSPYSPWEQLLEDGRIIEDMRYTALSTTKARKECFDEWSRERIAEIRARRAAQGQEKKSSKDDPRVAYLALLQDKATPRLYWPEFKRKYKKEDAMRDLALSDKEREKAYREHINRLKMPQASRKADLTALLRAQPGHLLHSRSLADDDRDGGGLPTAVLTDLRYISLEPQIRDPLIEAYVQTLPPPPPPPATGEDAGAGTVDEEERRKAREARERRERALAERNRAIEEKRRLRERDVAASKARLRDEERELEMAMRVGKRGLQSQLASNMPSREE